MATMTPVFNRDLQPKPNTKFVPFFKFNILLAALAVNSKNHKNGHQVTIIQHLQPKPNTAKLLPQSIFDSNRYQRSKHHSVWVNLQLEHIDNLAWLTEQADVLSEAGILVTPKMHVWCSRKGIPVTLNRNISYIPPFSFQADIPVTQKRPTIYIALVFN